jgi:Ca-activated chloride channel family protein
LTGFLCQLSFAQKYYVRGEVKDEAGNPLQNVQILQHSTGYVFRSGTSGNFGITSNVLTDTFSFSLDGYKTEKRFVNANEYVRLGLKLLPPKTGVQQERLVSFTSDLNISDRKNLIVGDETYTETIENHFVDAAKFPKAGLALNVDRASYSNIRRFLNQSALVPIDAIRIEEMLNYFSSNYQQPSMDKLFAASTQITPCPWSANHRLLHLKLNSQKLNVEDLPPSHLVFLIDVSASMDMPNRLPLLQSAFHLLVNNLRSKDSVSIVAYGGLTSVLVTALSGGEKDSLFKVIDGLTPGGSTPGESGIKLAYQVAARHFIKEGNNRVVLATDGDFNVGLKTEAELDEMISAKRQSGVYLTCLGVGMGNYKDSKIQLLAEKGNGNFAYLDSYQEAEKVLMKEFTQTLYSVADDVYLNVQFDSTMVKQYRILGFDNKATALKDSSSVIEGGEIGSGYTMEAIIEIEPTVKLLNTIAGSTSAVAPADSITTSIAQLQLQFRYPSDTTHRYYEFVVPAVMPSDSTSFKKYQFSNAVAYFGLLLRGSPYVPSKKTAWEDLLNLAIESADPTDKFQQEFIQLIQKGKELYGHKKKKGLMGLFN